VAASPASTKRFEAPLELTQTPVLYGSLTLSSGGQAPPTWSMTSAAKRRLRHGVDHEIAADIVWVLNDPGLYDSLVHRRHWAPDQYRAWLAATMIRQLLPSLNQAPE